MAEIVQLQCARLLAEQQELANQAAELIDALGSVAGFHIGHMARFADVDDAHRRHLLALAAEIDRRQGFRWYFAYDTTVSNATSSHRYCRPVGRAPDPNNLPC